MIRYAVVRLGNNTSCTFSTWHVSLQDARIEAERLCKKEGVTFSIIQEVAHVRPSMPPIEYVDLATEPQQPVNTRPCGPADWLLT